MTHINMKFGKQLIPANTFIRFILVGVMNTAVGLGLTFLILHLLEASYWVSTFFGNGIGACVSYYFNRTFTFQSKRSVKTSSILFLIVIISCYFLSYGLSGQLMAYVRFIHGTEKQDLAVLLGAGFYTISNYYGQKKLVFRTKNGVSGIKPH